MTMGSYKEYIEAKRNAWIGKKVKFQGRWDCGSGLALIPGVDSFRRVTKDED
jgi:hypothetical protein